MRAIGSHYSLAASCRSSLRIRLHPLPGVAASSQGQGNGLSEQVRSRRVQPNRRHGYRRPYYAPYFCARPYQYRYWQFYAPICYPL
jgi:hypothetical protein